MPAPASPTLSATPASVGAPWTLGISGVAAAETVIVEFYGANGGIFRMFPRGRDEMSMRLTPKAAGEMTVLMTCRAADLTPIACIAGTVTVSPAGTETGPAAPANLAAARPSATALGVRKPPYMLPYDTFAGEEPPLPASQPSTSTPGAVSPADIARDMQARTDALLNRLTKR